MPGPETIRLRGVRQNNLQGFDLDLPLGKLIVVTGLSGAGKSSLVFETLHAEGQRRYVETFSPYTRQFLERLDRPRVDRIENIRPSIAIEQANSVRTTRSTVGTMTELCDYFKAWWPRSAQLHDPATGEVLRDDNPRTIWRDARARWPGRTTLAAFAVKKPAKLAWPEVLGPLRAQGYARVVLAPTDPADGPTGKKAAARAAGPPAIVRLDELEQNSAALPAEATLLVVQDRVALAPENEARFLEAARVALHFGQGAMRLLDEQGGELARFSEGLHSPHTGRRFRAPTPALFSFNSPVGACPKCRGFGRVIQIDERLVIPDHTLTLAGGAIRPFQGAVYGESRRELLRSCAKHGVPGDVPWRDLTDAQRKFVWDGEAGYGENGRRWPRAWYGVKRFFEWLEGNAYKMHVRVFLSKYRAYTTCPACRGARLQPEALLWRWRGRTLPELYQLPVDELLPVIESAGPRDGLGEKSSARAQEHDLALEGIVTRLRYLRAVGLGYLTLDRPTRTLSGGETERVNLTTCLGSALVETLFVLDEPSVGLHPRDIHRLIGVLRRLADQGNTVVVVEHDEAVMRAADHLVEIGPAPGKRGGRLMFSGPFDALLADPASLTGAYLSGRKTLAPPAQRRPVDAARGGARKKSAAGMLELRGVTLHNLRALDVRLPLQRLVGLCGVSGSGKSTLLENALYDGLRARRGLVAGEPARLAAVHSPLELAELVLVDQSPVSRTPRSNAALYSGAWDGIRQLFAAGEAARAAGFTASHFSFNAGQGRCPNCEGLGSERVEMQFMSDLFVPCPVCEGRRFIPEVLACAWSGKSVAAVLALEVREAREFFAAQPGIAARLRALEDVGLGYLPLGQPLTTLSGGESQRLKLVRFLSSLEGAAGPSLLLLDEPTTGLHRDDVGRLLEVLQRLVDRGHSVVVVEHQPDVLLACDWLLELGPEAGAHGGRIVAEGPPERLARAPTATAPFLAQALAGHERPAHMADSGPQEIPARSPALFPVPNPKPETRNAKPETSLIIRGAREHNLRNLDVALPRREFIVLTGVSGSGKSSLAFDIVFAEGQRRFMESMSAYARQFVEQLPRPDVDEITGIPPTVAIEQRVTRGGRKSTVATVTEVAPYLRLLYARLGVPHSLATGQPLVALAPAELAQRFRAARARLTRAPHAYLCAPLVRGRKGHHQPLADWARAHGHRLLRCDGRLVPVENFQKLDRYREHDVEVVVADFGTRAAARPRGAAAQRALDDALRLGKGAGFLLDDRGSAPVWFSTTRTDPATGEAFPELDPKHFSWNSPRGWCPRCRGHGRLFAELEGQEDPYADAPSYAEPAEEVCPACGGARLGPLARAVKLPFLRGPALALHELLALAPAALVARLARLDLDRRGKIIAAEILPQIAERLKFMDRVGLGYLGLDRSADTLSGGEAQRIRLAAQLGSNLAGVLYVLDEPSIGLHARDHRRLLEALRALQEQGNTLLVVEHDEDTLRQADRLLDLGPGAGAHGGRLVAQGTVAELLRHPESLTAKFLREGLAHPRRGRWRELPPPPTAGRCTAAAAPAWLVVRGARRRNLRGAEARFPLGRLVVVSGPSGAGKSTLVRDVLEPAAKLASHTRSARLAGGALARAAGESAPPLRELLGGHALRAVIEVGQDPIGQTPRSTPATYIGAFAHIRELFAQLPEARIRGHGPGWFSFNTKGGRCERCAGAGRVKLEMSFLPETWVPCDECGGDRYGPELRELRWNSKNIAEVLRLPFDEAAQFFSAHRKLKALLDLMVETGLGYLTLGQSSPTLSGGEAQRLKLVSELVRGLPGPRDEAGARGRARGPAHYLYILEEPTIGLHQSDVVRLIDLLHRLVDQGHTVVVIEHHLDIIAEADWVIELGPDGGDGGGRILYQGPVAGLARRKDCPTAPFLRGKLGGRAGARTSGLTPGRGIS